MQIQVRSLEVWFSLSLSFTCNYCFRIFFCVNKPVLVLTYTESLDSHFFFFFEAWEPVFWSALSTSLSLSPDIYFSLFIFWTKKTASLFENRWLKIFSGFTIEERPYFLLLLLLLLRRSIYGIRITDSPIIVEKAPYLRQTLFANVKFWDTCSGGVSPSWRTRSDWKRLTLFESPKFVSFPEKSSAAALFFKLFAFLQWHGWLWTVCEMKIKNEL